MRVGLDEFELKVYNRLIKDPQSVIMLPVDIWASMLCFCLSNELYEECNVLKHLEDKVSLKSSIEFLDEYVNCLT